ncbi:MAG TPA: carboxypeptidase-like regulatory domain-containing protein [Thermoanaerobaculia bacterium]|nr:carboxypeptidase-like regulatory domain-containing protein [Thermoanaerobaculia bacterium]
MTPLRQRATVLALLLVGTAGAALAEPARPAAVAGRVLGKSSPLGAAGVYAYQLADLTLRKVSTDPQGNFLFRDLPAGLYKVIAHKAGFLPAVVLLTRTTAQTYQFVELQLAETGPGQAFASEDFWALRARIPADVLHEIDGQDLAHLTFAAGSDGATARLEAAPFQAEMAAMTGLVQGAGVGEGQISGGRVGVEGRLGELRVGLSGDFWQLGPTASRGEQGLAMADSHARAVSLEVAGGRDSRVALMSRNNRMVPSQDGGEALPVGLEQYQVSWTQALGERGHSDFSAQYTSESNYHRHGGLGPIEIPRASRTWGLEGSYETALGDRSHLEAGLRYRERQATDLQGLLTAEGEQRVDLFGRSGVRLQPAVLVEYGLYTTLRDGSLSLTPRGGVVLQLGSAWQAEGSVSRRVYEDPAPARLPDFVPALFREPETCEQAGDACYELSLSRQGGEDELFSLSAVQRTLDETLRLYFSEDFFDRLDSLYLVGGDTLREVEVAWSRRLSPQVVTRFESSLASGGGGIFHATDERAYENEVRWAVSSLDTRFQATSTGVFLAFHQLDQQLRAAASGESPAPRRTERLQMLVSQDLNVLLDLAAEWAVQLNMELSRGAGAAVDEDEESLRRRIMGGIAVKF